MNSRIWEVFFLSALLTVLSFAAQTPAQEPAPSIGIAVGEKAPPFTATDQFGDQVSSDNLKGPNGTVLVFFRSADW